MLIVSEMAQPWETALLMRYLEKAEDYRNISLNVPEANSSVLQQFTDDVKKLLN